MIIVGQVLDRIGAVARDRVIPHRTIGFDVRTDFSHEPLELRASQPAHLPVMIGHDWSAIIGAVRHLEVGAHPQEAWAVCDTEELPDDVPLYFSLEGQRGGRDGAVLSALGVTMRPASIGLAPLRLVPGDLRGLPEAETLRLRRSEPWLAGLLERARSATKRRRYGEPLMVEGRSAPPAEGWSDEYPVGPIRYGPPGRILSVR